MAQVIDQSKLTRKDFSTDQDVRWCPGCGDYSILANVQRVMPEVGVEPDKMVWVSGIGCAARFPYYMNTYGFHTIHGRAPAFVTGIKATNPDLSVWLASGDGDSLSIGGNHLMHCLRRNLDVRILLFNNRIYGLTKGQYSPTSEVGKITASTPTGSADQPVDPCSFALGCNATFVARSIDVEAKHLGGILMRASEHRGAALVEIYQNCNVFNDGAFKGFTDKEAKADNQLRVEHGKPMLFGKENTKGLRLNPKTLALEVVTVGENGVTEADVLVHDETNGVIASLLVRMPRPTFPVAIGVFFRAERPTYDATIVEQQKAALERSGPGDLEKLLNSGNTWEV